MQDNALQIATRGFDKLGRGLKCLAGDAGELRAILATLAKPLPDLEGECTSEAGVIEDSKR